MLKLGCCFFQIRNRKKIKERKSIQKRKSQKMIDHREKKAEKATKMRETKKRSPGIGVSIAVAVEKTRKRIEKTRKKKVEVIDIIPMYIKGKKKFVGKNNAQFRT